MGFLRSEIDLVDGKYRAKIVRSWYYLWEDVKEQDFDELQDALDWVIQERCYGNFEIKDSVNNDISYSDALRLNLKGRNLRSDNDNKKFYKKRRRYINKY